MRLFEPQPARWELPARLASPFADGPAHPLALRAVDLLLRELDGRAEAARLFAPGGGKMFGVLVVERAGGEVGWLAGFSGMLGGAWDVTGFVPPLFDVATFEAERRAGEAELARLAEREASLASAPALASARLALEEVRARHAREVEALRAAHALTRARRREARGVLEREVPPHGGREEALAALTRESQRSSAERRDQRRAHAAELERAEERVAELQRGLVEVRGAREETSRRLLARLQRLYALPSFAGDRRNLIELFSPEIAPGGAGDCAAPKLLGAACRLGLRPLALAEVWVGAPPATGDRTHRVLYPACRRKCGRVLPFMLRGLDVDPAPIFGAGGIDPDAPRVLYEDERLAVLEKPVGLLSVPGRTSALADSVLTRLRARWPDATGPILVHRLDLDVSGVLLAAKDHEAFVALQRQFSERSVDKCYEAWLEGQVAGESGVVDLALRVDLDDRPRQLHDPVHGKRALTTWRVLARAGGRTRVELVPHTGRTHQLRVHAAHPLGLNAPITGDRLYGRQKGEGRLLLHAVRLTFVHPHTGRSIRVESAPPF